MRTAVVVDNPSSWFMPFARRLVRRLARDGESALLADAEAIASGTDITFLLSCEQIVPPSILTRSEHTIVVHASALPSGRGMSPLAWQILEGENEIPVTLFEAVAELDAGPIYLRDVVEFSGSELLPELQTLLGKKIVDMCVHFAADRRILAAHGQSQTDAPTYYPRRTPKHSRLDPSRSIADQFDLLRIVDNRRYPAFFELRGRRYVITIKPAGDKE